MIKQMKTLISLYETESIEKTAAARHLSSEEVIRHVELLEDIVGVSLVTKEEGAICLTPAGRAFNIDAQDVVYIADSAILRARQAVKHEPYIIRVGTSLLNPCGILLNKWEDLKGQYPQYKLNIIPFVDEENLLQEAYNTIGKTCDILIETCDSINWEEHFNKLPLGKTQFSFTMSKKHRLAKKKILSLADLRGETILMEKRGINEKENAIRDMMEKQYPEITILDTPKNYDKAVFERSAQGSELLLTLQIWDDVFSSLVTIPSDLDITMPYSLLYPFEPSKEVARFVQSLEGSVGRIWQW